MARSNLFPCSGTSLEVPEGLCEFQWLHHNALLLFVISDLSVSSKREVLAQWMAVETIVGHNPSEIGMTDEEHAEKVVDLALVPICAVIETGDRRHGCRLVCIRLHPDPGIVTDREQIVDDLKSLISCRVVDGCDVADLCELGSSMVLEEGEGGNDASGWDVDGELVLPNRESEARQFEALAIAVFMHTVGRIWADTQAGIGHMHASSVPGLDICLRRVSRVTKSHCTFRRTCWIDDRRLQFAGGTALGVSHVGQIAGVASQLFRPAYGGGEGAGGVTRTRASRRMDRRPQRANE